MGASDAKVMLFLQVESALEVMRPGIVAWNLRARLRASSVASSDQSSGCRDTAPLACRARSRPEQLEIRDRGSVYSHVHPFSKLILHESHGFS